MLAAVVVLLISFGSFLAMGLPIVTALFGLGTGAGLIGLGTHVIDMADFSLELAAMIGLGVGIDYALFILTRFREIYGENGGDVARGGRCWRWTPRAAPCCSRARPSSSRSWACSRSA